MSKILVIDDTKLVRTAICRTLVLHENEIFTASNGLDGLRILQEESPDLIITDILMPVMEGLETIRAIRRVTPDVPIIAISGVIDTPFLTAAVKLGAVSTLTKPFNDNQLLEAVSAALPES